MKGVKAGHLNYKLKNLIVVSNLPKQLTNMRASGMDEIVTLTPPHCLSREDCIAFINDDELVEVTTAAIRLRKWD